MSRSTPFNSTTVGTDSSDRLSDLGEVEVNEKEMKRAKSTSRPSSPFKRRSSMRIKPDEEKKEKKDRKDKKDIEDFLHDDSDEGELKLDGLTKEQQLEERERRLARREASFTQRVLAFEAEVKRRLGDIEDRELELLRGATVASYAPLFPVTSHLTSHHSQCSPTSFPQELLLYLAVRCTTVLFPLLCRLVYGLLDQPKYS